MIFSYRFTILFRCLSLRTFDNSPLFCITILRIWCCCPFQMLLMIIKIIPSNSFLFKSKGQVLIFLPNSSFCRSFRSTRMSRGLAIPFLMNGNAIVLTPPHASDDIIFMYIDWSVIVSCAVFRYTSQRYIIIPFLQNIFHIKWNSRTGKCVFTWLPSASKAYPTLT